MSVRWVINIGEDTKISKRSYVNVIVSWRLRNYCADFQKVIWICVGYRSFRTTKNISELKWGIIVVQLLRRQDAAAD